MSSSGASNISFSSVIVFVIAGIIMYWAGSRLKGCMDQSTKKRTDVQADNISNFKRDSALRTSIFIITEESYANSDRISVDSGKAIFATQIQNLPISSLTYFKDADKVYVLYNLSASKDMIDLVEGYLENGRMNLKFSPLTDSLKSILVESYGLSDIVGAFDELLKKQADQMNSSTSGANHISEDVIQSYKSDMKRNIQSSITKMKLTYKELYNEELHLDLGNLNGLSDFE
jgi:hypothetical protein